MQFEIFLLSIICWELYVREIKASFVNRTLPRILYLEKKREGYIQNSLLVGIAAAISPYLLLFHRDDTITSRKFQWKRRERERERVDDRGRSGKKVVGPGVKNGFFVVDRGWPNFRQRKKKRFFLPSSSSSSSIPRLLSPWRNMEHNRGDRMNA